MLTVKLMVIVHAVHRLLEGLLITAHPDHAALIHGFMMVVIAAAPVQTGAVPEAAAMPRQGNMVIVMWEIALELALAVQVAIIVLAIINIAQAELV
jgi:hypothetical protein